MVPRFALIVDNPLRDLDGLALLAWVLARRGAEVLLVPMYAQRDDVFAFSPRVVLLNYLRPNNLALAARYASAGMAVAVLDTEGAAGKTLADFGRMVARMSPARWVDRYCVWGPSQKEEILKQGALPESRVRVTGTPRYDFAAPPWNEAERAPGSARYVLITGNFPLVNPRFSKNVAAETKNLERVWDNRAYTQTCVEEGLAAFRGFLAGVHRLAASLPEIPFVLRPHPFEGEKAYADILSLKNMRWERQGTSLDWIQGCAFLIHLNSTTAVESALLGKIPVAMDWLVTPTLRLEGPSSVSQRPRTIDDLISLTKTLWAGGTEPEPAGAERRRAIERLVPPLYGMVDGKSAERAADVLWELAQDGRAMSLGTFGDLPWRQAWRHRLFSELPRLFSPRVMMRLKNALSGGRYGANVAAKNFELKKVQSLMGRFDKVSGSAGALRVELFQANSNRIGVEPSVVVRPLAV